MNERFVWVFHLLISLLLLPNHSWANEQHYGYRITTPGKTVIQIARDVYNDERQWKKIAYWNNLTPPYALSIGQILVLPQKPAVELSKKNLVVGEQVPAPQFLGQLPSVSRVIWNRKGYFVYEVNERAPSLSMVALENYGDKNMWKFIARWNGLAPNEHLNLSQKLILHEKPTLTGKQANAVLIKEWVRVGNISMAQRLGYQGGATPAPKLAVPNLPQQKLKTAQPEKPIEQVEPVNVVQPATEPAKTHELIEPAKVVQPTETKVEPFPTVSAEAPVPVSPVDANRATSSVPSSVPSSEPSSEPSSVPSSEPPQIEPTKVVQPTEPKGKPTPKTETSNDTHSVAAPSFPTSSAAVPAIPVPGVHAVPSLPSLPSLPTISSDEPIQQESAKGSTKLPAKKVKTIVTEPTSLGPPIETVEAPIPSPNLNPKIIHPSDDPELAPKTEHYVEESVPTTLPAQPTPLEQAPQKQYVQPTAQPLPEQQVSQPTPAQIPAPAAATTHPQTAPTSTTTSTPAQVAPPEAEVRKPSAAAPTDTLQMPEPASESYWLGSDTLRIMKSLSKPNGK